MTTAFQPNAFQSDAFQIDGGVAATSFEVTFTITEGGDTVSLSVGLPSAIGAPSAKLWVAIVNGKRVVGSYWDIQRAIEAMAMENAEKQQTLDKPKRFRIVVKPGKPVDKTENPVPEPVALEIQRKVRDLYQTAYARAMVRIQEEIEDEEDILLLL